jgi:hypothetical protein
VEGLEAGAVADGGLHHDGDRVGGLGADGAAQDGACWGLVEQPVLGVGHRVDHVGLDHQAAVGHGEGELGGGERREGRVPEAGGGAGELQVGLGEFQGVGGHWHVEDRRLVEAVGPGGLAQLVPVQVLEGEPGEDRVEAAPHGLRDGGAPFVFLRVIHQVARVQLVLAAPVALLGLRGEPGVVDQGRAGDDLEDAGGGGLGLDDHVAAGPPLDVVGVGQDPPGLDVDHDHRGLRDLPVAQGLLRVALEDRVHRQPRHPVLVGGGHGAVVLDAERRQVDPGQRRRVHLAGEPAGLDLGQLLRGGVGPCSAVGVEQQRRQAQDAPGDGHSYPSAHGHRGVDGGVVGGQVLG